jgi:hypothetical protein
VFPDGAIVELVQKAGSLNLCVFDGKHSTIAPEAQFRDHLFLPAKLSLSIRQVVKFPEKCIDFGSTAGLFASIQKLFASHGFPEEAGLAATHFSFATWFIEASPIAPCLLITGSRLEASLLLQLLGCLVRHPVPLGEFTRHSSFSLPIKLAPTLLINADSIGPAALALLRTSNHRNAYFPLKDGLVDFFCAKAVFCGDTVDSAILGESALHINLPPCCGRLPILDEKFSDEIAQEFQSKFLAYRCHHFLEVRESQFDLPEFTSATRILARVFGAPIVDAPALQAGLTRLLRDYEEKKLESSWTDLRCVVIEAVLHHCHKEPGERVHVGKIAQTVKRILMGRGDETEREPREIGPLLTGLGLSSKRDRDGYAVLLDSAACRHIHRLAQGFGLLAMRKGEARCLHCQSILNGLNARNGRASESEKNHA